MKPETNPPVDADSANSPLPWTTKRVQFRYGCYGHEITPPYRGAMTMRSAPIAIVNSDTDEDRANMKLIVRAVNNADKLAEKLKQCLHTLPLNTSNPVIRQIKTESWQTITAYEAAQ